MKNSDPTEPQADAETETVRVQVVARWNNWVQVRDPRDESLRWIDLGESNYSRT